MLLMLLLVWTPQDVFTTTLQDPIPAEEWAIGTDVEASKFDAVIIDDTTQLASDVIRRYRKVRIFSVYGKSAVSLVDIDGMTAMEGRVVTREGTTRRFSQDDVEEVLAFRTSDEQVRARMLVPPGITADCVVEMRWQEPADDGMPEDLSQITHTVQEAYYLLKKTIKIPGNVRVRFSVRPPSEPGHFEKVEAGQVSLIFRDIAPWGDFPFGLYYQDANASYVTLYRAYDRQPGGGDVWPWISEHWLQNYLFLTPKRAPKEYKNWIKQLKSEIKGTGSGALTQLVGLFRARFKHRDLVTDLDPMPEPPDAGDEKLAYITFERGFGTANALCRLFYQTAMDLGLPIKLVYPSSIEGVPIAPSEGIPWHYHYNTPYFGMDTPHGLFVTVVHRPYYPPGLVQTSMEGVPALVVDPKTWTTTFVRLPRTKAGDHQINIRYEITLEESGKAHLVLTRDQTGIYKVFQLDDLEGLSGDEQNAVAHRFWSKRLDAWRVTETRVATEGEGFTIKVDATLAQTRVKDVLVLNPFPAAIWPIHAPSIWPPERSRPLYLEHRGLYKETSVITVPQGWSLKGFSPLEHANDVGSVRLSATQEGNRVTLVREVTILEDRLDTFKEPQVKAFVTWMEQSGTRSIVVAQGGA